MFAKNLKRIMDEKGMNSATLVQMTGFSKAAISQYINGVNMPSQRRLEVFAEVLDTSIAELTGKPEMGIVPVSVPIPTGATTLTVRQVARLLHKHESYIHQGLREGRPGFEFGTAVKTSGRWSYCIYANKFTEITGIPLTFKKG